MIGQENFWYPVLSLDPHLRGVVFRITSGQHTENGARGTNCDFSNCRGGGEV